MSPAITVITFLPGPKTVSPYEWVELYNDSNESYDLGGWKIDDEERGAAAYTIAPGTLIEAQGKLKIELPRGILNNDADEVRLLRPDGSVADVLAYRNGKPDTLFCRGDGEAQPCDQAAEATSTLRPTVVQQVQSVTPQPTDEVSVGGSTGSQDGNTSQQARPSPQVQLQGDYAVAEVYQNPVSSSVYTGAASPTPALQPTPAIQERVPQPASEGTAQEQPVAQVIPIWVAGLSLLIAVGALLYIGNDWRTSNLRMPVEAEVEKK